MDSIPRQFYEELVQRVNQLRIRGNRHKVALFTLPATDQATPLAHQLTEVETEQTAFTFTIIFERNNSESGWRLVTPLKFIE